MKNLITDANRDKALFFMFAVALYLGVLSHWICSLAFHKPIEISIPAPVVLETVVLEPTADEIIEEVSVENTEPEVDNSIVVDTIEVLNIAAYGTEVCTVPLVFKTDIIERYIASDPYIPDWDYKHRFGDMLILSEVFVNQLGVPKNKAAAIIGNVCIEDSFTALTSSAARCESAEELYNRLGPGTRGFGIAQWTFSTRQDLLEQHYKEVPVENWELLSVIAECSYLYAELEISGILGDLSTDDMTLEDATGKFACEFEGYNNCWNEWYTDENGTYHCYDSGRMFYAEKALWLLNCEG